MYIASKDIKMAFGVAGPKHVADILGGQKVCGWIAAAQSREMKGVEGDTAFKNAESKFNLSRCNRQGSVEAPTLRLKSARLILWSVEKEWKRMRMGGNHQICSFQWADNHWMLSHSKMHLEQMMKELIEEPERWDLKTNTGESVVVKHLLRKRIRKI